MTIATFDKLSYLETLKHSGVPEVQARAHAIALDDALRDSVATKSDVRELEHKIESMEQRIIIKLGAMIGIATAFLAAIQFFK